MKQTTYRFSLDHDKALAGKNFTALETATLGLLVVQFEDGCVALTHEPSGWAVIHGTEQREAEELGLTAGALGGLPIDWTQGAASVLSQTLELDDLGFRIFLLLTKGKKKLTAAHLQGERFDIAKRAANLTVEQLKQARAMAASQGRL